jgi:hypothetical protein
MAFGTAINAIFGGDTGPLQSAAKRVEVISAGVNKVLGAIGVGLSAAAAVGTFVALGKGAIELGGKLSDMSAQLGINVERLQVLMALSRDAGVSQETLAKAIVKVRTSAQESLEGNKALSENYATLGINVRKFLELPAEQRLAAIGKAYASATDKNAAFNAVTGILGEKAGPKLMEVLGTLAGTSFPKLEASARQAGEVMSAETVAALDQAGDAIEAFKQRITIAIGNIIVNFRTEEGLKLMGLQLLGAATKFAAHLASIPFNLGQLFAAVLKGTFEGVVSNFRNLLADSLEAAAKLANILLPKKWEIQMGDLSALRGTGQGIADSVARAISKTQPTVLVDAVSEYYDGLIADQKKVVEQLNKVDFKVPAATLRNAGNEFKTGIGESADKLAGAGKIAADAIKAAVAGIAGIRGAKQFDQLSEAGLAELIRRNERQIEEIRRKVREGGTPELAGGLEIGRIQAENMNARQDLNQRTGFQQNLNRLGVEGARALYDPFVFEELLKRFDASRPLEQKSVDTLDEIRRGQERLLSATVEQTDATADVAQNLDRGLSSLAAHLKDR